MHNRCGESSSLQRTKQRLSTRSNVVLYCLLFHHYLIRSESLHPLPCEREAIKNVFGFVLDSHGMKRSTKMLNKAFSETLKERQTRNRHPFSGSIFRTSPRNWSHIFLMMPHWKQLHCCTFSRRTRKWHRRVLCVGQMSNSPYQTVVYSSHLVLQAALFCEVEKIEDSRTQFT